MQLEAGTRLGHYEIVSALGAGGMGEVYRAKDTELGREVAIKVLPEGFSDEPERMARFEREAKVLAGLNHTNIATLYSFEADGSTRFLVMEVVEGETLAERIGRGPIPVDEALQLFLQIAEGLEAAHEKGVIHRDLKPANIKVSDAANTAPGRVKILDFGLAKAMAPAGSSEADPSESPTITAGTREGVILGTAAYMSPEQAQGRVVDNRTDIWAFGACLYEALTRRRTFGEDDVVATLAAVLRDEPAFENLPADTPLPLRRVLRRCLAKDPRKRLRHIGDAILELQEALDGPVGMSPDSESVAATGRPPAWMLPLALAASALVASLAVWVLKQDPPEAPRPLLRSVLSGGSSAPVVPHPFSPDVAVAPDGTAVVYNAGGGLYVRRMDSLSGTRLTETTAPGSYPFFSPDGAWVGYPDFAALELRKISPLGEVPITICRLPGYLNGGTWGMDDNIIFGVNGDGGIYRVAAVGGEPENLAAPNREKGETSYRWPVLLPGEEAVLFTILSGANSEQAKIAVLSFSSGEQKVLVETGSYARYVPTGHLVYGENGTLRAVPFDLESLEVRGNSVQVLEGVLTKSTGAVDFDISRDGSLVYVSGDAGTATRLDLVWVDREGREETLSAPSRTYASPRLSPDGQFVALTSRDDDHDVWIWDLIRQVGFRMTNHPLQDHNAVWSPDSREIIFASSRGGSIGLYRRAADGSGSVERLSQSPEDRWPESISPDGKLVVYREGFPAEFDLGVLALDGGRAEPLLAFEGDELNGEISPDGKWLAYESNESTEYEIWVRPFPDVDSRRSLVSTGGGRSPSWAPDGQELFYRTTAGAMMAVRVRTEPEFQAGTPEELFNGPYRRNPGRSRWYDVSPDGQRFLMIKQAAGADGGGNDVILVQNWFEELERLVPTD